MLGSDDVLACFIAGNAFTWDDWFRLETMDDSLQPTIDMLLNVAVFMWFGAVCPWHQFVANDVIPIYRLIPLGILVLLLRRLPMVLGFHKKIHQIEELKHAAFVGFFGPIGVSAIFYLYIAREFLRDIQVDGQQRGDAAHLAEVLNVVIWFLVICSITVHGLSIPLGKLGFYLPRTISTAISSERVSAAPSMARADGDPSGPDVGQAAVNEERSLMRYFKRSRSTATRDSTSEGRSTGASWVPRSIAAAFKHIGNDMRRPEGTAVRGGKPENSDESLASNAARPEISGPRDARLIGHAINDPPVTVSAESAVSSANGPRVDVSSPPRSGTATPVGRSTVPLGWQRSIRFGDEQERAAPVQ